MQTLTLNDNEKCTVTVTGLDDQFQPGQLPTGIFHVESSDQTVCTVGNATYPNFDVTAAGVGTASVSASIIGPAGVPVFPPDSIAVIVQGGPDTTFTFSFGPNVPK